MWFVYELPLRKSVNDMEYFGKKLYTIFRHFLGPNLFFFCRVFLNGRIQIWFFLKGLKPDP